MINFSTLRSMGIDAPYPLPEGYTQLESLRSNGPRRVYTYFKADFTKDLILEVTFSVATANSRYCLFGNYKDDYSNAFNFEVSNDNRLRLYVGIYGDSGLIDIKAGWPKVNKKHTARFEWHPTDGHIEIYLDGERCWNGYISKIPATQTNSACIFTDNRDGWENTFSQSLTIYALRIANGTNGCNIIPCREITSYGSERIGLYDLQKNDFDYGTGSGTFTAGPVKEPRYVSKIEDASGRVLWIFPALNTGVEFASASAFSIEAPSPSWDGTMEYYNGNGWKAWDGSTISSGVVFGKHAIYIRGKGNTQVTGNSVSWTLSGTDIECNGNAEKLLDYATVIAKEHPVMAAHCFSGMFQNCSSLIAAPSLPATTLANSCYHSMFKGCTNLTTVTALPATVLADSCYNSMFYGCTNLTTVTALPATVLADSCYKYMYYGCKKIFITIGMDSSYPTSYRIPMVGTGTTASYALTDMFTKTGGHFITTPSTPNVNTTYFLGASNTIV